VVRFNANEPNGADGVTKIDFAKSKPTSIPPSQVGQPTPGQDFDELDSWEDPQRDTLVIKVSPDLQPSPVATPVEVAPAATKSAGRSPASPSDVTLWQLISRVKLSFFELCGLFLLLGLLTAGGIAIYFSTYHRLPSKPAFAKAQVFPVTGEHLTLVAASTYWRPPAADETVRRGTKLLPALSFKATGGPAAIRVFFRDSTGSVIGDAVTQPLKSGSEVEISATSGYEDLGMHAGYRTGQDPPWTIEIFEAPAGTSVGADFKKLLTLPVSTVCH
jgi:hypothetical protein